MMTELEHYTFSPQVGIVRIPSCSYGESGGEDSVPAALDRISSALGWANEQGPLGRIIWQGARVLIKPNFVLHENQAPAGLDPLVTHPSVVRATVEAALRSGAGQVLVGDAPIQSCDLPRLLGRTGLDLWASDLMQRDSRFKGIRDFRRTVSTLVHGVRVAAEDLQPRERFVLFDLGKD